MNWDFGYTVSASELKAGGCGGWFSFVCAAGKISRVSAVKLSLALADESLLLSALCYAAIAQLDRAPDYESGGLGFDSLWPHQLKPLISQRERGFLLVVLFGKQCEQIFCAPFVHRFFTRRFRSRENTWSSLTRGGFPAAETVHPFFTAFATFAGFCR